MQGDASTRDSGGHAAEWKKIGVRALVIDSELGLAAWPSDLNFAMFHDAVSQIQIDQALIGNTRLGRHSPASPAMSGYRK